MTLANQYAAGSGVARQVGMFAEKLSGIVRLVAQPSIVQLVLRLGLSVPFWRSGVLKWDGFLQLNDTAMELFTSEFMLVSSTFARQPVLSVVLVFGLLVAFGALFLRLQDIVFGEPTGKAHPAQASYIPAFVHLTVVLIAGIWLPGPIVEWFRTVAVLLR